MSEGAFDFWMVFPFIWGAIGVGIIGVACIREIIMQIRGSNRRREP